MTELILQLLVVDLVFSAVILAAYELAKAAWNLIFS